MVKDKSTKKICIISPSLKMGGIERALTVLANYFSRLEYSVSFVSAQGGEKFYELDKNIAFYEPNLKRKKGIVGKIHVYYKIISFINKTVTTVKPDVVLSFGDAFNPLVLYALRNSKVPVYISDRTSPDFNFSNIIKIGKNYLYPKAAGFIAQTKRSADYKKEKFKNKLNIKIIPNALKEVVIYDVAKKKTIVCVGRLSDEKGQDRLIKAFSKLDMADDWKLVLAGSGPMLNDLKSLAKDLHIADSVIFMGVVDNVDKLLSESSIFVLPSRLEGFPNALCEAMAAGLPCICFNSIPTEAILENKIDGLIVNEGEIEELSLAIQFLIENESERQRLGQNASKIKNRLKIDLIGNEFLSFMFK